MSFNIFFWMMSIAFCINKSAQSTNITENNLIPCKQGWFLHDRKCYTILGVTKGLNWKQASVNCSLERGSLATIHSEELQKFLVMFLLLRVQRDAWIGLHDRVQESRFSWDDHSPLNYTNWDESQPTGSGGNKEEEDCVEMRFENWKSGLGTWNDQPCDTEQPYVCQADESEEALSQDPRFCSLEEGEGWKYLNSCYHVVTEAKSWDDAESYCKEKYSGHLVTILDDKTEMFLSYLFSDNAENFWIGIKMQDQGIQVWSSGVHVVYKKWDHEQKHFLPGTCSMMTNTNVWEIGPCFRELPFICEKSNNSALILQKPPEGWQCPIQSKEWIDLGGEHCYIFETNKSLNWHTANYDCGRKGGTLASILSEAEAYVLQPHVKNTQDRIFIGLHRSLSNSNAFEWADGSKFEFVNWGPGEPNFKEEECGEIWTGNMKWNDIRCDRTKGYICSARKVPPYTPQINASSPNECVCSNFSNVTHHKDNVSASASKDQVCPSGMSTSTVIGIVICSLLIVILTVIVVYHSRNFCKQQRNNCIHRTPTPPLFNHISSEVILKPEEYECRM